MTHTLQKSLVNEHSLLNRIHLTFQQFRGKKFLALSLQQRKLSFYYAQGQN
jgi:hypothetical protein